MGYDSVHCGSGLSLFRKSLVSPGSTLNIEALLLWNADINFQTTWCHTLEDNNLNFHQCKNVSSCISISCSILSISQHLHAFITSTYWCSSSSGSCCSSSVIRNSHLVFLGAFVILRKRLLALPCVSVRMEQLGFHWTGLHEIWYLRIFRKSAENVSLKPDKNTVYFTLRLIYIFDHISPTFS